MRLKVQPKLRRLVALSVDAEEVAASVEVIVAVDAVVVREYVAVAVAVEDLLGHLVLFVLSLALRITTNLLAF